ncbi:Glycosyltransferase family 10 (fucosyltransferase) [Piscirickettsia salmonis]|uniref:glycosyltransferase family 10 domain-containing protein n=1 Tax=Piscirickettsia salmonis TaxID=1238 RepID=UPI0012BA961C|nr:glycosyltransferase family 10 [Piscirickettsia salmonis]QGP56138.1 Glycosyltransferase family 10 (fucosyltransferase) [Piscirickettsia salmonis]QGP57994.1 Glycosyltransferase family 10 (fucosyltransferase) [Piscirickettsia salmonis]QGP65707.1 Glycosyltransferase family 10 (fucosyltransferase) [Piscirickettsia salmonis]
MKTVCLIPYDTGLLNNEIFNLSGSRNRDDCHRPIFEMKEVLWNYGYDVNTVDISPISEADYILFFAYDKYCLKQCVKENKLSKSIYVAFEPEVVERRHSPWGLGILSTIFQSVLTWNSDVVDGVSKQQFYFPVFYHNSINEFPSLSNRDFITTIIGNKSSVIQGELYSERLSTVKFLENNIDGFRFYGAGWEDSKRLSYKGKVESKFETLKKYKFAICFENQRDVKGYITEKIFDCFYALVIPIYWGAVDISAYIPKECYIDRRNFNSNEQLLEYLKSMTNEDYFLRVQSIKNYLKSKHTEIFTGGFFAETLITYFKNIDENKNKDSGMFSNMMSSIKIAFLNKVK